jgi:hypothetical protein
MFCMNPSCPGGVLREEDGVQRCPSCGKDDDDVSHYHDWIENVESRTQNPVLRYTPLTQEGVSALTAIEMDQARRETRKDTNETELFLPALTGEKREPVKPTPVLDALAAILAVVFGVAMIFAFCLTK